MTLEQWHEVARAAKIIARAMGNTTGTVTIGFSGGSVRGRPAVTETAPNEVMEAANG